MHQQRRQNYCSAVSEGKPSELHDSLETNEDVPGQIKYNEDGSFIGVYGERRGMVRSKLEQTQPLSAYI